MIRNLFFLPLLALLLTGCPGTEIARNLDNASRLRVGMTKTQVLEIMGRPLEKEVYNRPDCWYYYVQTVWYDGLYTEDECLPLVFSDDKLIGWGDEFLSRRQAVDKFR